MFEIAIVSIRVMFMAKLMIAPLFRSFIKSHGFDTVDSAKAHDADPSAEIDPVTQAMHDIASSDAEYRPAAHFVQKYVFDCRRPAAHLGHEAADEHGSLNKSQLN